MPSFFQDNFLVACSPFPCVTVITEGLHTSNIRNSKTGMYKYRRFDEKKLDIDPKANFCDPVSVFIFPYDFI